MSDFITNAELRIEAERLCDENDQLKVENDELRNDADLLRAMLSQVQTEKRCYMAENAKLRELVEDMHAALQAFCDAQDVHGDNCPLWVERTDDCELRGIERRMRELGVGA